MVGASGAGKSTLLGLLLGLHVPVAGRVLVDGEDLNGDSDCLMSLRAGTAWVDPGVQLWNRSLVDNVAYGADAIPSEHDLTQALTDAELVDLSGRFLSKLYADRDDGMGLNYASGSYANSDNHHTYYGSQYMTDLNLAATEVRSHS